LIGWHVAGWPGALAATVALYLPSSLLVFGASRLWGRWRGSVWHGAIERGLSPIAAGLMLAGGLAVLQAAGGAAVWAAAAVATGVLLRWPRLNPLILFGASGVLFAVAALFGR
jgi:chromate transporter